MIISIISGNSKFTDLNCSISAGIITAIADTTIQSDCITFHSATGSNDVQDTTDTFRIIFCTRVSNNFNRLHRVGRQALQHFSGIVTHHIIRLPVYMHFKVAASVYLNFIFPVYGYQRYLTEHFESRIRF